MRAPTGFEQFLIAMLAVAGAATTAAAQTPPDRGRDLIARTPAAEGVFVSAPDGGVRHVQSGLVCPARIFSVELWHLQVYPTPAGLGADVGCDYGRMKPDRSNAAKLTIFAVKAAPDDTVDMAFRRYQAEVKSSTLDFRATGPAITFGKDSVARDGLDEKSVRSEEYEVTINGVRHQSDLIVALKKGWVIEVRATYAMAADGPDQAALIAGDIAAPGAALAAAAGSVGE